MKSWARSAAVAAMSLAAVGCRAATNPSPVAAQGCAARVASADVSGWQIVQAEGFTFCVPPDWSAGANGHTWSHGTARITWGVGPTVAQSDVPTAILAANKPAPACVSSPEKGVQIHPTAETIDGHEAQVWRTSYSRGFYTGGHWSTPHFYIVGDARDAATADLEMVIVRTARVAMR